MQYWAFNFRKVRAQNSDNNQTNWFLAVFIGQDNSNKDEILEGEDYPFNKQKNINSSIMGTIIGIKKMKI